MVGDDGAQSPTDVIYGRSGLRAILACFPVAWANTWREQPPELFSTTQQREHFNHGPVFHGF